MNAAAGVSIGRSPFIQGRFRIQIGLTCYFLHLKSWIGRILTVSKKVLASQMPERPAQIYSQHHKQTPSALTLSLGFGVCKTAPPITGLLNKAVNSSGRSVRTQVVQIIRSSSTHKLPLLISNSILELWQLRHNAWMQRLLLQRDLICQP